MALPNVETMAPRTESDYASADRQKIISGQNIRSSIQGSIRGRFQNLANETQVLRGGMTGAVGNNIGVQTLTSGFGMLKDLVEKKFSAQEQQEVELSDEVADAIDNSKLLKNILDSLIRSEKIQTSLAEKTATNMTIATAESAKRPLHSKNRKGGGTGDSTDLVPTPNAELETLKKQREEAEKFSSTLKRKMVKPGEEGSIVGAHASNVTGTLTAGVQHGVFETMGSNILTQTVMSAFGAVGDSFDAFISKSLQPKIEEIKEEKTSESKKEQQTPREKPLNPDPVEEEDYDLPAYMRRGKKKKDSPIDVEFKEIIPKSGLSGEVVTAVKETGKKQHDVSRSMLDQLSKISAYFARTEKLSNAEGTKDSSADIPPLATDLKSDKSADAKMGAEGAVAGGMTALDALAAADLAADAYDHTRGGNKPTPDAKKSPKGSSGKKYAGRALDVAEDAGKYGKYGKYAKYGKYVKGAAGAALISMGTDWVSGKLDEAGHHKTAATVDTVGTTAMGASIGRMSGTGWGVAAGALAGAGLGLYNNWDKLTAEDSATKLATDADKLAEGKTEKESAPGNNVINSGNTNVVQNQNVITPRPPVRNDDFSVMRYLSR